ncbi:MAG: DUF2304 family protein [Candidatus Nanoarchaeia archaeon]
MEISTLLIIIACLFSLLYIVYATLFKRIHLVYEIAFFKIGFLIVILSAFPQILSFVESTIGIVEIVVIFFALLFIVLFVIVFELYHIGEQQRREITKLSQEIAFMKLENEKRKK